MRLARIPAARWIQLLVAAGIVLRFAVALGHRVVPTSDFGEYHLLAVNVVDHSTYGDVPGHPEAFIPPAWPLLLALAYSVFGVHVVVGQMLAALLESGVLVCAALAATKLLRPRLAALAVGLLALHPVWIVWSSALASEHLGLLLVTGSLAIFVRTDVTARSATAVGLLLGLLVLNRPEVALCLGLALVVGWTARAGLRAAGAATVAAAVAAVVAVTPWIVRNELRFHEFIPSSTNGGVVFYLGTLSPSYTFGPQRASLPGYAGLPPAGEGSVRQEDFYWAAGWRNVKRDPLRWLRFDASRVRLIWFYDDIPAYDADVGELAWPHTGGPPNEPLEAWWHPLNSLWRLLVLATLAGTAFVVRSWRSVDPTWRVLVVLLVGSLLLKAVFIGDSRAHMTLTTAVVLLGGYGTQRAWEALRVRRAA